MKFSTSAGLPASPSIVRTLAALAPLAPLVLVWVAGIFSWAHAGAIQLAEVPACLPAEIQAIRLGRWTFVGWPGEVFVEFGLQVRQNHPDTFVISLANGDTQGYLVTAEAVAEGGYEASNGLFRSPQSGDLLVRKTLDLLKQM